MPPKCAIEYLRIQKVPFNYAMLQRTLSHAVMMPMMMMTMMMTMMMMRMMMTMMMMTMTMMMTMMTKLTMGLHFPRHSPDGYPAFNHARSHEYDRFGTQNVKIENPVSRFTSLSSPPNISHNKLKTHCDFLCMVRDH